MTDPYKILATVDPDRFKANFAAIAPLILEEWPTIAQENLMATAGEPEQVVDCIAMATDHTRALIRQQLRELYCLAVMETPQPRRSRLSERLSKLADSPLTESDLKQTLDLLEERTEELLQQFQKDVLPELNEKVRKNVGGSLLTALGMGFVLGLLMGGRRGR
jgi:hypothetical protein